MGFGRGGGGGGAVPSHMFKGFSKIPLHTVYLSNTCGCYRSLPINEAFPGFYNAWWVNEE